MLSCREEGKVKDFCNARTNVKSISAGGERESDITKSGSLRVGCRGVVQQWGLVHGFLLRLGLAILGSL